MSETGPPKSYVSPWLIGALKPIHRLIMSLYFRIRVIDAERIPAEGPVILAPTHRTRWDTLMLYVALRRSARVRPLRFLTSHDEVARGVQGWFVRRLGAFPINTRRPTPGALKHCREILMDGQPLVIFPEGNIFRLPPGEVHPLKPGPAWLAMHVQRELGETPLAIVPIRLNYSDRFLRFGSAAEIEVRSPMHVSDYLDGRSDKKAIRDLTADLQAQLGDTVNPAPRSVVDAIARGEAPPPENETDAEAPVSKQHDAA